MLCDTEERGCCSTVVSVFEKGRGRRGNEEGDMMKTRSKETRWLRKERKWWNVRGNREGEERRKMSVY